MFAKAKEKKKKGRNEFKLNPLAKANKSGESRRLFFNFNRRAAKGEQEEGRGERIEGNGGVEVKEEGRKYLPI